LAYTADLLHWRLCYYYYYNYYYYY